MGAAYDIGCAVGAKASELIDGTPPGYVTIGGQYADIGPSFSQYDDLPGDKISESYTAFSEALNRVAIPGQGSVDLIADSVLVMANPVFANMERIAMDVDNWTGAAADNFIQNYQTQLLLVADAHFTGISVAIAALEAQRELYITAHESILDIGNKTLSALEAADGRGSAAGTFALTVLAAAGTVAVTVLTAGTGTAAGVAVTVAVASGAASVGASANSMEFGGDSPEAVMSGFFRAVDRVERHVEERQKEISEGLRLSAAAVNDDIGRTGFADSAYPRFTFKPTGLANGPGGLGGYDR